jgi:hypothetical protein
MKYWIHVVIILLLGAVLGQYLPWWTIAVVAAVSSLFLKHKIAMAAMFGFLAGVLLWGGLSFYLDVENQHILSSRMGELFGGFRSTALVFLTGFLGGILLSLGSMVGAAAQELIFKNTQA